MLRGTVVDAEICRIWQSYVNFKLASFGAGRSIGKSQQHDSDALIAAAQVRVALQFRLRLQQPPGRFLGLRPVLPENAAANLTRLHQVVQTPVHCDADVAARARRSVPVDHFHKRMFLLASQRDLSVQPLQRLMHRRHIGLEVYGFNGVLL